MMRNNEAITRVLCTYLVDDVGEALLEHLLDHGRLWGEGHDRHVDICQFHKRSNKYLCN